MNILRVSLFVWVSFCSSYSARAIDASLSQVTLENSRGVSLTVTGPVRADEAFLTYQNGVRVSLRDVNKKNTYCQIYNFFDTEVTKLHQQNPISIEGWSGIISDVSIQTTEDKLSSYTLFMKRRIYFNSIICYAPSFSCPLTLADLSSAFTGPAYGSPLISIDTSNLSLGD